jgi:DNA-binding NarL/FixJ family response regulator
MNSPRDITDDGRETVLLADSELPMRVGMRMALENAGIQVVAEAADAGEAAQAAADHRPGVCLVSVSLPGGGITAAEEIRRRLPETKLLMLTSHHRDRELFESLRVGADGYLLKTTSAARLPHAVRGLLSGEAAIPRALVARLIQRYRERDRPRRLTLSALGRSAQLTAREFEVLELLRDGEATPRIAERLHISEVTVRRHVSAVMHKLGVADRRSAVGLLTQSELTAAPDDGVPA